MLAEIEKALPANVWLVSRAILAIRQGNERSALNDFNRLYSEHPASRVGRAANPLAYQLTFKLEGIGAGLRVFSRNEKPIHHETGL